MINDIIFAILMSAVYACITSFNANELKREVVDDKPATTHRLRQTETAAQQMTDT